MRRTGQVISVTQTKQTVGLGDPQDLYTLCNDSAVNPLYYRGEDGSNFAGNEAVLLDAGGSKLAAGEKVTVKGGAYNFACASGVTASCRAIYGNSSSAANVSITATADIGNVNLLDSEGGSVISPAKQAVTILGYGSITVTAASSTLTALLAVASITLNASTKAIKLVPLGTAYMNVGGAAVSGVGEINTSMVLGPYACAVGSVPDIRFITASGTTVVNVQQEA